MKEKKSNRALVEAGKHKHYIVIIQVFERTGEDPKIDDTQFVAAETTEQAVRRAGMRLVQRLRKKNT